MKLEPGASIGSYELISVIGEGGMGVVYHALDTRLRRSLALKFLPRDLTRDETAKARFVQEAQAASALDHPNIYTIYDIGETDDGQLYLAMAFYEGGTLRDRIAQGPLPIDVALDVAIQVSRGLAKAHAAGIVHRDVKPANLMFTDERQVKIVDFGLAKLVGETGMTQAGTALGTVSYMSPEQAQAEKLDQRSDIWSLGVVLFEMLAGQLPFTGKDYLAVGAAITNDPPTAISAVRSDVPAAVERIIGRALARRRPPGRHQLRALAAPVRRGCKHSRPLAHARRPAVHRHWRHADEARLLPADDRHLGADGRLRRLVAVGQPRPQPGHHGHGRDARRLHGRIGPATIWSVSAAKSRKRPAGTACPPS